MQAGLYLLCYHIGLESRSTGTGRRKSLSMVGMSGPSEYIVLFNKNSETTKNLSKWALNLNIKYE